MQENIEVVSIYKNLHSNFTTQARIQSFRIFAEAVSNKCGGNPNIRYAWYGTSTTEIRQIMSDGFNLCGRHENFEAYGCGLQLSPANFSIVSAFSAVSEQDRLRHVMLCRIILGNMKAVQSRIQLFVFFVRFLLFLGVWESIICSPKNSLS
ncbi:Poly(ADP-ribose) polymerase, catalytic domain [Dillenia turbinata]|uniref:Poly(ADP-ribose) polymerase, catalytic domain n=1 Tax=Dillenia turbinata TaxID=194707 RepID=A0AAN8VSX8_9MAGN